MAIAASKKKIIILCTMVALLVASGYLNWALTNRAPTPPDGETPCAFFAQARSERAVLRSSDNAILEAILNSVNATPEAIAAAEAGKLEIREFMNIESKIEIFLHGQQFEAYMVTVSSGRVHVMVVDPAWNEDRAFLINSFIADITDYAPEQILIHRTFI